MDFFTADCHFGSTNIIKYCNRPFKNSEHMTKRLIGEINQRCHRENSTLFHIGDFVLYGKERGIENTRVKASVYEDMIKPKLTHILGNHDCFSMDTRLLTIHGYKQYGEVKINDLIPTVNIEKRCIEYKPIKDVILTRPNKAHIITGNRRFQGEFSENHKHLYSFGTSLTHKDYCIDNSKTLWNFKSPLKLVSAHQSKSKDLCISNSWLKLFAWVITDGTISKHGYISISQSKIKYVKEIEKLLNYFKISYKKHKRDRNITEICGKKLIHPCKINYEFCIHVDSSRKILNKLKIKSKYKLPLWTWKMSDNQVRVFIDTCLKADGNVNKYGSGSLYGRKIILEQFMALCVTHNIKSNLIKDNRGDYYLTVGSPYPTKRVESYCDKTIYPKQRQIINYNDNMWCVNVENHIIFIENNGKTLITGNSNNGVKGSILGAYVKVGKKIAWLQHYPPWYDNQVAPTDASLYLCGHVHDSWKFKTYNGKLCINVGVDVQNYRPVSTQQIIQCYDKFNKGELI